MKRLFVSVLNVVVCVVLHAETVRNRDPLPAKDVPLRPGLTLACKVRFDTTPRIAVEDVMTRELMQSRLLVK